jgi:hypothetical protein
MSLRGLAFAVDPTGPLRYPPARAGVLPWPRATSCKVRQRTVTPPGRPTPGSIPGSPTTPSALGMGLSGTPRGRPVAPRVSPGIGASRRGSAAQRAGFRADRASTETSSIRCVQVLQVGDRSLAPLCPEQPRSGPGSARPPPGRALLDRQPAGTPSAERVTITWRPKPSQRPPAVGRRPVSATKPAWGKVGTDMYRASRRVRLLTAGERGHVPLCPEQPPSGTGSARPPPGRALLHQRSAGKPSAERVTIRRRPKLLKRPPSVGRCPALAGRRGAERCLAPGRAVAAAPLRSPPAGRGRAGRGTARWAGSGTRTRSRRCRPEAAGSGGPSSRCASPAPGSSPSAPAGSAPGR